jgi:hypothetical protein
LDHLQEIEVGKMAAVKIGRFTRDMFTSGEAFEAAVLCQRQVHPEMYAYWRPAVNGGGKRAWFLIWSDESVPVSERYYYGPTGNLVRFASCENAQKAADKLNAQVAS